VIDAGAGSLGGWIVPAYALPPNAESAAVLRMVVKENCSRDIAEMLGSDIERAWPRSTAGPCRRRRPPVRQRRIC
jgi:glutamate decarboxylase